MDLLAAINNETSVNSRQIDLLIKIDFFADFGNQRELLLMVDIFTNTFKSGTAKKIKKEKVDGTPLEPIIKKYAVGVTKSGGEAKSYTLLDMENILLEVEQTVKDMHVSDLSDLIKIRNFYDVMGYLGFVSGKEEDRPKLYVTSVKPLKRRSDGKQFGHSVIAKSIGSGKETRYTVYDRDWKDPIQEGEIILCTGWKREGQYYALTGYQKIVC